MTVIENKWLTGAYAPIPGDVTATELEVVRQEAVKLEGLGVTVTVPDFMAEIVGAVGTLPPGITANAINPMANTAEKNTAALKFGRAARRWPMPS